MSRAAVPAYLGADFREAAPGHRFALYLPIWDQRWRKTKSAPLEQLLPLTDDDRERLSALLERQHLLLRGAEQVEPGSTLQLPATSISPFSTGLGIEHPLENGFAFLTPYGLPYLAGSGVKGIVRQAARELYEGGDFEDQGRDWSWTEIEALLGSPGPDEGGETERRRGALCFWDVFPKPGSGRHLVWEIMTPHQSEYYGDDTGQNPPHDNGAPVPIHFLAVPTNSAFHFHIQCNRTLLGHSAPALLESSQGTGGPERWQALLQSLFAHAFAWLGFGAKTAVGYGALEVDERALRQETEAREQIRAAEQREQELAKLPPGQRLAEELLEQRKDQTPTHKFLLDQLERGVVPATEIAAVAAVALEHIPQRRDEIRALGNKKKRDQRLNDLVEEEKRLQQLQDGAHS
ncbi:type III-B CRISPR module RAMP protein Cmr6 [Halorhodospira abdelmalekii]|uniref:type III-B CRISPR module RAMP protein Cmr6 n=1 Tax=Halorhodospira abdelmalekii TaxID=421629 RepID=UPI001907FB04|nr:type III-B CRISPR module RAMP protein Cmr6 [Halorhodospira abdelmalekii]MBK1735776.1 type III-B CRISPR module RAMP protein Cmr6 [Halorhodospira abdelmalekii]